MYFGLFFADGIEEASRVLLACNHVRAIKLFIDSINGKCPYVGKIQTISSRFIVVWVPRMHSEKIIIVFS